MRTSRRLRTTAVLAGASTAVLLAAAPVGADQAEANVGGNHVDGYVVKVGDRKVSTKLIDLDLTGGNSLKSYCVEINVRLDPDRTLRERPWDGFPNENSPFHENRDKINWVLHHGYPAAELEKLEKVVTDGGAEFNKGLSKKEAITATQAAVWHYSDGTDLNKNEPVPGRGKAGEDVLAVYEYLTGDANVGIGDQPTPALEVTPKSTEGKAGERLGPFTITTTGEITEIEAELAEGATITDADGNTLDLDQVAGAKEFYVDIADDAAAGKGSLSFKAMAHLDTGRLFVSDGYKKKPAQSLIVAESEKTTMSADVSFTWEAAPQQPTTPPSETTTSAPTPPSESAPAPPTETDVTPQAEEGDLADTGVSILMPMLIGGGLLLAGLVLLLLQRRRKNV